MADEAEWFVARVEREWGHVSESESREVDQGEDGDQAVGEGGATASVHCRQSVLAEPWAS
jgi:hypothetical protein